LAARIKQDFGVTPELIQGKGGVFDVVVNGQLIYSKKETGRFPDHEEVLSQLPR
jgi:selenoprotein W-related protein